MKEELKKTLIQLEITLKVLTKNDTTLAKEYNKVDIEQSEFDLVCLKMNNNQDAKQKIVKAIHSIEVIIKN